MRRHNRAICPVAPSAMGERFEQPKTHINHRALALKKAVN